MVLPALRCPFDRSRDGSQHVALSEMQCDAARYACGGLVEKNRFRLGRSASVGQQGMESAAGLDLAAVHGVLGEAHLLPARE